MRNDQNKPSDSTNEKHYGHAPPSRLHHQAPVFGACPGGPHPPMHARIVRRYMRLCTLLLPLLPLLR
jgi:hypothetical protein